MPQTWPTSSSAWGLSSRRWQLPCFCGGPAFPSRSVALAGFSALPALLAAGVDFSVPQPTIAATEAGLGATSLLGDPVLWLCGLALFFYGPLEASLAAWATTYLGEQGHAESSAAGLLSAFWLLFMAARLVTAFSISAGSEELLLVILGLTRVAVLGAMVLARGRMVSGAAGRYGRCRLWSDLSHAAGHPARPLRRHAAWQRPSGCCLPSAASAGR